MNENNANFTPDAPNFKTLVLLSFQGLTNFPYIEEDFDALTNYGLLSKVIEYLNEVIANNNEQNSLMTALYNAYVELQDYVNDYFDNLDVQEEINNKLDAMAQDGSLYNIIKTYTDPIVNQQNALINQINNKVNSVATGSPLVANNLSDMVDTTRTYVLTSNGKWYYYDGDSWEIGGDYQSATIGDDSINYNMLVTNLQENVKIEDLETVEYTVVGNFYNGSVGSTISMTAFNTARAGVMNVNADELIYIPFTSGLSNFGTIPTMVITDVDDKVIVKYTKADLESSIITNNEPLIIRMPSNAAKLYFNNNLQENVNTYGSVWYPYKIKSYNYTDTRLTFNMNEKTTITPDDVLANTLYSINNWNRPFDGYHTLVYNVNPLEKLNIVSIVPPAQHLRACLYGDSNGKPTGYELPAGSSSQQDIDIDVLVPAGTYKLYISVPTNYIPTVARYSIGNSESVSNKKLSVNYVDGTLSITNNSNRNTLTFTNYGGNNLFMIKSYKVGNTTKTLSTDMIPSPYIMRAVNNADGDKTEQIFTGGNHQWNNQGSGSTPTARQVSLTIYGDNTALASGTSNFQCDSVKIIETNRVQGWNTCKQDGSGREILEEVIAFNFDGITLDVINTIKPLEEIVIQRYYGIQTSGLTNNEYLAYADKVYDVNTQYSLREKPYRIYGGNIISSILNDDGLGSYKYNTSNTKVNISNGKSYFAPIYNNEISFKTTDINYIVGKYIFDINQK